MDYTARYNELLGYLNDGSYTWIKFKKTIKSEAYASFSEITDPIVQKGLVYYLFYEFNQATRDLYLTSSEQIAQRKWLFRTGYKARAQQVVFARESLGMGINYLGELMTPLTPLEALQMDDDVKEFERLYITKALPDLYIWFLNGAYPPLGMDFIKTGFNKKPYYTQERFLTAYDIFINGNYDNTIDI